MDSERTKINCNYILYVFKWFRLLNIITWNISMLKIEHAFEIKIFWCMPKEQITFIRSCVNRCSCWNKSCDSRFTRGVSWSLPVFSIKKIRNSQGNLIKILFKVLTIGFYAFCSSFRQIMDTIPKKLFSFKANHSTSHFSTFSKLAKRCSASECPIDAKRW